MFLFRIYMLYCAALRCVCVCVCLFAAYAFMRACICAFHCKNKKQRAAATNMYIEAE